MHERRPRPGSALPSARSWYAHRTAPSDGDRPAVDAGDAPHVRRRLRHPGLPGPPCLPGPRPCPRPRRLRAGPGPLHPRGRPQRPGGLSDLRPDAVRLGLRPRRLPRPRLHCRLPPPPGPEDAGAVRRARRRGARPSGTAGQPPRPGRRHPPLDRRPGRGLRVAGGALPRGVPQPPVQRRRPGARRGPRPGRPYSYTNSWPPEPLVGNHLTQEAVIWSTLSIIALLGGIGALLALFGRYASLLGWHGEEERRLRFLPPQA